MVGDDLCLSGPDESSQTGTAFPETGTSLKDVVMHHVAHTLREWNAGFEGVKSPRRGTAQDRNAPLANPYRIPTRIIQECSEFRLEQSPQPALTRLVVRRVVVRSLQSGRASSLLTRHVILCTALEI